MNEKVELSDLLPHFHLFPGFHSPPSLPPPCRSSVVTVQQSSPQDTAEFTQRLCFPAEEAGNTRHFVIALFAGRMKKKQISHNIDFFFYHNWTLDGGHCRLQSLLPEGPGGGRRSVGGVCGAANGWAAWAETKGVKSLKGWTRTGHAHLVAVPAVTAVAAAAAAAAPVKPK